MDRIRTRMGWTARAGGAALVLASASACSNDSAGESSGNGVDSGPMPPVYATGATVPATSSPTNDLDGSPRTPEPSVPEVELDPQFELPHAGERYVYAANPESDTVAVIDATTLAIQIVEAGDEPRFLQTLDASDSAIVLNVGSEDATVIRTRDGASTVVNVGVDGGSNAISVAPDGQHAVVYFNSSFVSTGDAFGAIQGATVLDLGGDSVSATSMSVGYRPQAVYFDEDGGSAFVVAESDVSVLNFADIASGEQTRARTVALGADVDDSATDVSVTRDGRYALARQAAGAGLRLVELETGDALQLDLEEVLEQFPRPSASSGGEGGAGGSSGAGGAGGSSGAGGAGGAGGSSGAAGSAGAAASGGQPSAAPPVPTLPAAIATDVDLASDSSFAVAVVRSRGAVLRIPVPGGFEDPAQIEVHYIDGGIIGSVSLTPDGNRALLYTTVVDNDERLTILELGSGKQRAVDVRKAILNVATTRDGANALIVHRKLPGDPRQPGLDPEVAVDRAEGYSMVDIRDGFAKLELTDYPVQSFSVVDEAQSVFLSFAGANEIHRVRLADYIVETVRLASAPTALGPVPQSEKLFVSQEHPDGRVTFIDWNTLEPDTVTGFELNSQIREAK